jgi:hypothetical protein
LADRSLAGFEPIGLAIGQRLRSQKLRPLWLAAM